MADPWTYYWMYSPQHSTSFGHLPHGANSVAHAPLMPMWMKVPGPKGVALPSYYHIQGTKPDKLVDGFYSAKYPELHPALARDTFATQYDLKRAPKDVIHDAVYHGLKHAYAFATPFEKVRLISADFPWSVKLKMTQVPITVAHVWEALYHCLQQEIADSEWGILTLPGCDKKRQDIIMKARDKRLKAKKNDPAHIRPRRIDWLGDKTYLKGLDKDPDLMQKRAFPGKNVDEPVWVVRMGAYDALVGVKSTFFS